MCSDTNAVNLSEITRINYQARAQCTSWAAHNLAVYKSGCSFTFFFLFLPLALTGVCPITVNMVANAPRRGTASSAIVMELDTVVPLAITVSPPALLGLQWSKDTHVLKKSKSSSLGTKDPKSISERKCWLNHIHINFIGMYLHSNMQGRNAVQWFELGVLRVEMANLL